MPGDVVNRLIKFTLDASAKSVAIGTVKQYSVNTVTLEISLVDKGAVYTIPEGCRVTISTRRPDGTITMSAGTFVPNTNVVTYVLSTNELEQEGVHRSEVLVFGTNSDLLVSSSFVYHLENSNYDGSEIQSQPQYPILVTLMTEIQSSINAVTNVVTTEAARVEAENARVSAENSRSAAETARAQAEIERSGAETARLGAELARSDAEALRNQKELAREQSESQRVVAEESRNAAEGIRTSSESERVSREGVRASNEQARVQAETLRAQAETARQSAFDAAQADRQEAFTTAEAERKTGENQRIASENERVTSENARNSAETGRVSAEADRKAAESARATAEIERRQFIHRGNWSAATAYLKNNTVHHAGSSYIALKNSTGQNPATSSDWAILAKKGQDGAGSGDMHTSVYDTTKNGVVDNAEKLEGRSASYFATADALVQTETKAQAAKTAVDALSPKVAAVEQSVSTHQTEIASLKTSKADLASPAFTGTPTAPTQGVTHSSTRIATTAHVRSQRYISTIHVPTTGWTAVADDPAFQHKIKITANSTGGSMTWLATRDVPHVYFDRASLKAATDAGIFYVESVAGGLELYANKVPETQLTATVFIVRG